MPDSEPLNYYQLWLNKAEEDVLAASNLMEDGGPFSPVCFHCQQAAEKFLKALLAFHNDEFPKVHDLLVLAKRLESKITDIQNILEDLEYLNHFYTEARYADDYKVFTQTEAREALEKMIEIKEFVLSKIKAS